MLASSISDDATNFKRDSATVKDRATNPIFVLFFYFAIHSFPTIRPRKSGFWLHEKLKKKAQKEYKLVRCLFSDQKNVFTLVDPIQYNGRKKPLPRKYSKGFPFARK